jgi:hypothetical protein
MFFSFEIQCESGGAAAKRCHRAAQRLHLRA